MNEPIRTHRNVTVRTEERSYRNADADVYEHWTEIHTSREEPSTDPHVWVPNSRITEIVDERHW